jgi:hypothetical protein
MIQRNPGWETLHEPLFNITSHPLVGFSRGLLISASTFLTEVDAVPIFFTCAVCLSYPMLREVINFILSAKKKSNLYSIQFFLSFWEKQLPVSIRRAFTWQQLMHQARLMRVW